MSHLSLPKNVPSDIRLPSISTLAQQRNIRLPELKDNDAVFTLLSLMQLSKSERTLPLPILPHRIEEEESKRRNSAFVVAGQTPLEEHQMHQGQHQVYYSPPQHSQAQPQLQHQQHQQHQQQQLQQPHHQPPQPHTQPQLQPPQYHQLPPLPQYYHHLLPQQPLPQQQQHDLTPTHTKPATTVTAKDQLSCQRCGTTETPEWRRGPNGARTLCNACGLYHAKLVKRKGAFAAAEEMKFKKVKVSRPPRARLLAAYRGGNPVAPQMSPAGHFAPVPMPHGAPHHHQQYSPRLAQQQYLHIPPPPVPHPGFMLLPLPNAVGVYQQPRSNSMQLVVMHSHYILPLPYPYQ